MSRLSRFFFPIAEVASLRIWFRHFKIVRAPTDVNGRIDPDVCRHWMTAPSAVFGPGIIRRTTVASLPLQYLRVATPDQGMQGAPLRAMSAAFGGIDMPTNLPARPPRESHAFALFALLIALSFFVIEIVDPASMESQAASIASP